MLLAGEHPQKGPEHHVKTTLRFGGGELGNRKLPADDKFELRDEGHDELTIRANGLAYRVSPTLDPRLTLGQDLANVGAERLSKRGIRNIPVVLVELPRQEEPARQDDCFVQLMDDRGLADPGIAGDEKENRRAGGDHLSECREQGFAFSITPIEFLRHQKPVRRVARTESERGDASPSFPFVETPLEIGFHTGRSLIALFGGLGEEL